MGWGIKPRTDIEKCSFSCSIRSDDPEYVTLSDSHINAIHRFKTAKILADPLCFEEDTHVCSAPSLTFCRRRISRPARMLSDAPARP